MGSLLDGVDTDTEASESDGDDAEADLEAEANQGKDDDDSIEFGDTLDDIPLQLLSASSSVSATQTLPPPPPPQAKQSAAATTAKRATDVAFTGVEDQSGDDFGIAYKPYGAAQQAYVIPCGPLFSDERDFEQELSAEFAAALQTHSSGPVQDDFDCDDGTVAANRETEWVAPQAVRTAAVVTAAAMPPMAAKRAADSQAQHSSDSVQHDTSTNGPQQQHEQLRSHCKTATNALTLALQEDIVPHGAPVLNAAAPDVMDNDSADAEEQPESLRALLRGETGEAAAELQETAATAARKQLAAEWQAIDTLQGAESLASFATPGTEPQFSYTCPSVTLSEALMALRESGTLESHRSAIVPVELPSGLLKRLAVPRLSIPDADAQRDEIFLIGQVMYNPASFSHRRMLQTVYRGLTGSSAAVCAPETGSHWDAIGFQGLDPCTDLNRSQGILSLLQVMALLEARPEVAAQLMRDSAVHGWPLMCVSIGFTKEAVAALRRGAIYGAANRHDSGDLLEILSHVHQAQFHDFMRRCHQEPSVHHAVHLCAVRAAMEKSPEKLLKAFEQHCAKEAGTPAKPGSPMGTMLLPRGGRGFATGGGGASAVGVGSAYKVP
ncbi:ELMO/CED-12 family-domain-containing protein [Tribonema minus]|uniref:ELMO/CED-12 family-domain-containing protein n=1 Tax=Tribonema minus TaxID=303371 RepID=A0A836CIH2_9STRA|nr:ELMO/CED-12 family-domain-containing protein [Tribonema minus]